MKRKLNLMNLNCEEELYRDQMQEVYAGFLDQSLCVKNSGCACGCAYSDQGGSSTTDNMCYNNEDGLHSPGYSYSNSDGTIGNLECNL